ncbi:MAG TPA: hypothetical protein VLA17_04685 [Candidatus Limnocylindria bacterium]|nr:hypothetical protein [Candidatus Limnocylindria bacterium]
MGKKFLSLIYIYPFKFQLCGFRFPVLQRDAACAGVEENRRVYDRLEINCPVTCRDGVFGEGSAIDVSAGAGAGVWRKLAFRLITIRPNWVRVARLPTAPILVID